MKSNDHISLFDAHKLQDNLPSQNVKNIINYLLSNINNIKSLYTPTISPNCLYLDASNGTLGDNSNI